MQICQVCSSIDVQAEIDRFLIDWLKHSTTVISRKARIGFV